MHGHLYLNTKDPTVGKMMCPSLKEVPILISRTCEYIVLHDKSDLNYI